MQLAREVDLLTLPTENYNTHEEENEMIAPSS
jgi:hypothetical protein